MPKGPRPARRKVRAKTGSATTAPRDEELAGHLAKPVTGHFFYTFTLRLPFVLGISDNVNYEVASPVTFRDLADREVFGRDPSVRIRIFNAPIADRKAKPANLIRAVTHFYNTTPADSEPEGIELYEQWVSVETPGVFLHGENETDPAFAFHRCLFTLNTFLTAFALARADDQIRPISARELRPIVVIGSYNLDGSWSLHGEMLMHPDAKERTLGSRSTEEHIATINEALARIMNNEPFLATQQWLARAERRKYEGDAADAIVSYQIAAETYAFDLWRLLLEDEGLSQSQIDTAVSSDKHFRTLLTRELGHRLGGSWDLTLQTSAMGRYWAGLYSLRNRVVHAGYLPHDGDAEQARSAFEDFRHFTTARIQMKRAVYPVAHRSTAAFRSVDA
jgi:hypothetical protein